VKYGRRASGSWEFHVDNVYVAESACIFGCAPEDAWFVEILGEASDRGGMSLACFPFLVSAYSAFIRLMQSQGGNW
jgi:hypothetical protein